MFTLGGGLIARALKAQGVNTLYTLSGGHILPTYEGCLNNEIAVIDMRHEQAAAHSEGKSSLNDITKLSQSL